MFYIKYITMHKVHMHTGAIRQLLYGCAYVREGISSNKRISSSNGNFDYSYLTRTKKTKHCPNTERFLNGTKFLQTVLFWHFFLNDHLI